MEAKAVINDHIQRKCRIFEEDPDTVSGHIENERAITNDYRGRVLYELLQNAVDRAERNIWITVDTAAGSVTVANDGVPFSAVTREGAARSDFAALCAIHTSNKRPGESIGNKGVGFKSVWEFCHAVQVRTRTSQADHGWGIRLRWPFTLQDLNAWPDSTEKDLVLSTMTKARVEAKHQGLAPSFYFPEYLGTPTWREPEAVTAIELENLSTDSMRRLIDGPLQEILQSQLVFAGDIRRGRATLQLIIKKDEEPPVTKPLHLTADDWIRIDIDTSSRHEQLMEYRQELGFDLSTSPRLSLAFAVGEDPQTYRGKIHSYLPTELETGSPLHIQGDFYLSESRKSIDFKNNAYNALLLDMAIDALIQALTNNTQGVSGLPYALDLLNSDESLKTALGSRLMGKGAALADILEACLNARERRNLEFYDDLYAVIARYMPPRPPYSRHHTHEVVTLEPYFTSLSRDTLKIVPVSIDDTDPEEPVVITACPLPSPSEQTARHRLFCRKRSSTHSESTIDISGLTVTDWSFPANNDLAGVLKKLKVWSDYDAVSILRAIVASQQDTGCQERANLLEAAAQIHAPESSVRWTQCNFTGNEVHPSQRLLIPVLSEAGWAEARYCFIVDQFQDLGDYIDESLFHPVDTVRCRQVLGEQYLDVLKYWGVWNVAPLFSPKGKFTWEVGLSRLPTTKLAISLFAASLEVWQQASGINTNSVLRQLRSEPWLIPHSGNLEPVAPATVYLGVSNTNVPGFHLVHPDGISESERLLLRSLGVQSVDNTADIGKLVQSLEAIVTPGVEARHIRGPLLSTYRQLIKRINVLLHQGTSTVADDILQRIPLLYERVGLGARGVANSNEAVWYVPETARTARGRLQDGDPIWLAIGDIGTLASQLDQVHTLRAASQLHVEGNAQPDTSLRALLEQNYLPKLLALACYTDLPGIQEVDEHLVQGRWQSLNLLRAPDARLVETFGSAEQTINTTETRLTDAGLLWEPRTGNPKTLSLYIHNEADIEAPDLQLRLATWFAEEIFHRRELTAFFVRLIKGDDLFAEYSASPHSVRDACDVIKGWIPDSVVNQLIEIMTATFEISLTQHNWRDPGVYRDHGLTFADLIAAVPAELSPLLTPLDPEEANFTSLLRFVDESSDALAATHYADGDEDQWRELFDASDARHSFDFNPQDWLLTQLGMSEQEFLSLADRLDAAIAAIQKDQPETVTLAKQVFDSGNRIQQISAENLSRKSISPSLAPVRSSEEHSRQKLHASKVGIATEKLMALAAAQNMAKLADEDKAKAHGLIIVAYEHLQSFDNAKLPPQIIDLLARQPSTLSEKDWASLIHVAGIWDGAGYDYLDYQRTTGKLCLVEAKSSQRDIPTIYFSESERNRLLDYHTPEFQTTYPDLTWMLLVATPQGVVDLTTTVVDVVLTHNRTYSMVPDTLVPESWALTLKIQQ